MDVVTNDTNFVMETASPNLLIFTVAAINVLGTWEGTDITSELCTYYKTILMNTSQKSVHLFLLMNIKQSKYNLSILMMQLWTATNYIIAVLFF